MEIDLYHYSPSLCGEFAVIDPECFLNRRHSYSRRDYQASDIPRSFFYLNPMDKENIVNGNLYHTKVSQNLIYDLNDDPLEYRVRARQGWKSNINVGAMNISELVDMIHRELVLTEKIQGIFYGTAGLSIVNMFVPVEARLMKENTLSAHT
jgi:hypothetical protein